MTRPHTQKPSPEAARPGWRAPVVRSVPVVAPNLFVCTKDGEAPCELDPGTCGPIGSC